MFGSIALDVAIGLVLVYLLYSLLITIIGEMVATWLGLRARILRKSIERMLNDEYDEKGFSILRLLVKFFLVEFKGFKYSFAGRFYNHPSIIYLSQGNKKYLISFSQGKPAYISQENFSDTIVQLFRNKGNGINDMEKINFCLKFNTLHIQPQTLAHFRNLLNDSNNDINTFKEKLNQWFNDTQGRANGWYKKKLQLILFWLGFLIAISFNVDSIKIAKQLSKDKDARNQLVQMGIHLSSDSLRYKDFANTSADTIHSQTILDSAYSHVSKDINDANLILGLGWKFDDLRTQTSSQVPVSKKDLIIKTEFDSLKANIKTNDKLINKNKNLVLLYMYSFDSLKTELNFALEAKQKSNLNDSINHIRARIQNCLQAINTSTILNLRNEKHIEYIVSKINSNYQTEFIKVDEIDAISKHNSLEIKGYIAAGFGSKVCYFLSSTVLPWKSSFWGFVITALMLSLGAPFWFDLLKKLVALRGAGVKPEEKEKDSVLDKNKTEDKTDSINVLSNDPVELALSQNKSLLESIPGVIAVNYDYCEINGQKSACIEVTVEAFCNQTLIPHQYSVLINNVEYKVDVLIKVSSLASLHFALNPNQSPLGIQNISNQGSDVGWGTVSGIVQNIKTKKKAILSCAHVMAGNNSNNELDGKTELINFENETIAKLVFHLQSNTMDIAFADTSTEIAERYVSIKDYGEVIRQDGEYETEVVMNGFMSGKIEGVIVNYKTEYPFSVNNLPYTMVNLIKLTVRVGSSHHALSQSGDSGALITRKKDGIPLGIVIGGTHEYSYAISLKEIFYSNYIKPTNF
jgi:hypothetical protein